MLPALRIFGYDLQELIHQGTNTAIYRAVSLINRQPAILKVLNTEYPTLEQITRLKHEYQITLYLDCEYTLDLLQKKYVLSLKICSSLGQTLNYWVDWHLLKLAQPARL